MDIYESRFSKQFKCLNKKGMQLRIVIRVTSIYLLYSLFSGNLVYCVIKYLCRNVGVVLIEPSY